MPLSVANRPGFFGRRFGRLVIVRKHGLTESKHLLVLCQCDCGNETVVRWSALNRPIHKGTLSCGCIVKERVKDIKGKRFNRLLVLERAGSNEGCQALWKCLCDCGVEITTEGVNLRSGGVQSCGCLNDANRSKLGKITARGAIEAHKRPYGEAAFSGLVAQYRRNARVRKREWSLTNAQARILFTSSCHYCGRPPEQIAGGKEDNGTFIYNGIDRVDSGQGYTLDNLVPCCKWCNWIKGKHSVEQFLSNVARIARHHPEILGTLPV